MSSAKAALESDTRVLAYEAGRKHSIRVNAISAGPLGSRAAKAIGFIDDMIKCAPVLGLHLPGMAWQDRSVTRQQQTGPSNPAALLVRTAAKLSSVLAAKCWLGIVSAWRVQPVWHAHHHFCTAGGASCRTQQPVSATITCSSVQVLLPECPHSEGAACK